MSCCDCTDIDECQDSGGVTHDCDSNAFCSNKHGTFECHCRSGYTGDGKTCQSKFLLLYFSNFFQIYNNLVLQKVQTDCYLKFLKSM